LRGQRAAWRFPFNFPALLALLLLLLRVQGRWYDGSSLLTLPHITDASAARLAAAGLGQLPELLEALGSSGGSGRAAAVAAVEAAVGQREARDVLAVCERLPVVGLSWQAPKLVQRAQPDDAGDAIGSASQAGGSNSSSYSLEVELQRLGGKGGSRQSPPRAYAPRYPKASPQMLCCAMPCRAVRLLP
jgi:activating signal cointegrator complex subunit 3